MALPITCEDQSGLITEITRESGNDLRDDFTMRYRLASDPDVDGSYSPVTTVKNFLGLLIPYFDVLQMPAGTYVVHNYATASGSTTGTKVRIDVECGSVGVGS